MRADLDDSTGSGKLAAFYSKALNVEFEKEDDGGLDIPVSVDIGDVHFGFHPPET